jgi:hypothetical protein
LAVIAVTIPATSASAATLTYLRFENASDVAEVTTGTATDPEVYFSYSGNGVTMIPASGATSNFPNPIPQNSLANTSTWDTGNRGGVISTASNDYNVTTFSFEAFFNAGTGSGNNTFIASRWGADDSWGVGIGNDAATASTNIPDGNVFFLYYNGSANQIVDTGINLARGLDHYLGITVDSTGANSVLTVYYQDDLSTSPTVQSQTFNLNGTVASATVDANFAIGSLSTGTSNGWIGYLDEVRMSDTVLAQDDLLAVVPEPATMGLLAMGGIALLRRRRR